jgi:hypothetical protein
MFADSVDLVFQQAGAWVFWLSMPPEKGGLSPSISAIALVSLSLSAIVPLMSSPSLVASRDFCHVTFFSNVWGGFVDLYTLLLNVEHPGISLGCFVFLRMVSWTTTTARY